MNRIVILDRSVPGSQRLLGGSVGDVGIVEVDGVAAAFAAAVENPADETIAVGDGTTTLAVASAIGLTGRCGSIRPVRRGADAWTEAAGIDGTRLTGGRTAAVPTLRVESLQCPWPIVCASAALGGAAELLAKLHSGASATAVAREFARAIGQVNETSGWGDRVPWGLICSASGKVGGAVTLPTSDRGFTASCMEPARGGGLLGLVRGVAGILAGGHAERVDELVLEGDGAASFDGWTVSGADRLRVTRGPDIPLVG